MTQLDFAREQRILHLATALSAGTATREEVQEAADSLSYAAGERMGLERKVDALEQALAFYMRVMNIFHDIDMTDSLWWKTEDKLLRFYVMCSDEFALAYADAEELTTTNLSVLESAIEDVRDTGLGLDGMHWALTLFVSRVRNIQPHPIILNATPPELKPLFASVGEA